MDIKDLNQDERLALVALVKGVIMADSNVSAEEVEELQDIVDELGEDAYQALLTEVESRFSSDDGVRKFLGTITRQDAREVIYGTVMEMALTDSIDGSESEVLAWLAEAWKIEVKFDQAGD